MIASLLVIAAGGTGGHMFPAQALAEAMLGRGWRVILSTDDRGRRYAGGFPEAVEVREVSAATFARGALGTKLLAPFRIAAGVRQVIAQFRRDRPAAVIGFGGYPAIPALAAAWMMSIPRLIHEQNGVLGRVNRLFARHVDRVACGTWPLTNLPSGADCQPIGNPIRAAAFDARDVPYSARRSGEPARLLVFGGSQGAGVFSDMVPAAIRELPETTRASLRVAQQVRPEDSDKVAAAYAALGIEADLAMFFDDMPARIASAQLVIARAGASTIAEITAIGRPAILIPYPHAMDDHQTANGLPLADAGAAFLMAEQSLNPAALAVSIGRVLGSPEKATAMADAARALGRPDAARDLADMVEALAAAQRA